MFSTRRRGHPSRWLCFAFFAVNFKTTACPFPHSVSPPSLIYLVTYSAVFDRQTIGALPDAQLNHCVITQGLRASMISPSVFLPSPRYILRVWPTLMRNTFPSIPAGFQGIGSPLHRMHFPSSWRAYALQVQGISFWFLQIGPLNCGLPPQNNSPILLDGPPSPRGCAVSETLSGMIGPSTAAGFRRYRPLSQERCT